MPLISQLFKDDQRLQACLIRDDAHVKEGSVGTHVSKIHTALFAIDHISVAVEELKSRRYGPSTVKAVLSYKKRRNIINFTYEMTVDNIVGKMTIASLDREMVFKEQLSLLQPASPTTISEITFV